MRLLALEAGGPVLGAALLEDGSVMGQAHLRAPQRQTESLAPMVLGLLGSKGWTAQSLDALACAVGPGSFTGLRSSLAFGRGLALGKPALRLVGVPTLEAWAEAFSLPEASEAWVLLDGRRGQAYRGVYRRASGAWQAVVPPALLPLEQARPPAGRTVLSDLEAERKGADCPLDSAALALAVGRLAWAAVQSGSDGAAWEPQYLRRSEAEILWERLHPPKAGA